MVLQGTALVESFTLGFSVQGQRGQWTISITAPHHIPFEKETTDVSPYATLQEMLDLSITSLREGFQTAPAPRIATKTPIRRAVR